MYKAPSARRRKQKIPPLNLVPILDCVFILNFFLIFSADFMRLREIGTDLPILASTPLPDKEEKKQQITVKTNLDSLQIYSNWKNDNADSELVESFPLNVSDEKIELSAFHQKLLEIQKENPKIDRIILKPMEKVPYRILVMIMDQIKQKRDVDGSYVTFFGQIIFGNVSE